MLDPDKIKADITGITKARTYNTLSKTRFEEEMILKFPYLADNAKTLFYKCCSGEIDNIKIDYMLKMMQQVIDGAKSEYDASVNIGQKLVNEYVLPLVKDK